MGVTQREHEVLAPVNIFLRPKSGVHPWISPVDLKFLDAIVQRFINLLQSAITELVYFIEPHDHLNPVSVSECNALESLYTVSFVEEEVSGVNGYLTGLPPWKWLGLPGLWESDDGIVQAGSGVAGLSSVRGFHQFCLKLTRSIRNLLIEVLIAVVRRCHARYALMQLSLRNLELQCLLTDLPDEWMRPEVVEEELEQSQRLQLCQKLLMRLMVVVEEVVVKVATQGEAWRFAYFSSSFPPNLILHQVSLYLRRMESRSASYAARWSIVSNLWILLPCLSNRDSKSRDFLLTESHMNSRVHHALDGRDWIVDLVVVAGSGNGRVVVVVVGGGGAAVVVVVVGRGQ
ncbi:hypothetical protein Tco_1219821 [Tanacetum coccineum]